MQDLIKEYNLGTREIESPLQYNTSGLRSIQPRSELSKVIKKGSTSDSNPNKLGNKYKERRYGATLKIYTDGSKDPSQPYTGCAMVVPKLGLSYGFKLNQHLTV